MADLLSKAPIVCLMGPTAAGKTPLAVALTQRYPFSIISVDSAMVYREMNVGTAKPSANTLKLAPHRLIDILEPNQIYSAGRFMEDAIKEIKTIHAQGHIPLLVGGTMLYFRVLQQGFADLPLADPALRAALQQEASAVGWEVLHQKLQIIDPESAQRIHPSDSQRIQRALEVYMTSGKTMTALQTENQNPLANFSIFNLILAPKNRTSLHERIALRFQQMIDEGFVDEVKRLYTRGDLHKELPSMRAVGYSEMWDYLEGEISYDDMCNKIIAATRQLAKRQLTWLRPWPNAIWFESEAPELFNHVTHCLDSLFTEDNKMGPVA